MIGNAQGAAQEDGNDQPTELHRREQRVLRWLDFGLGMLLAREQALTHANGCGFVKVRKPAVDSA